MCCAVANKIGRERERERWGREREREREMAEREGGKGVTSSIFAV